MGTTLFTCFGTIVVCIGTIILLVYVVFPMLGICITFIGRLFRFVWQEGRDILLIPLALFVGSIKLLRGVICIILARWDIVHVELQGAKRRFVEAGDKAVAVFIDNPLRLFGVFPSGTKKPNPYTHHGSRVGALGAVDHRTTPRFAGYTIVGTLPSGGSGAKLYVAKKHSTNKEVVIKYFNITSGSQLPEVVRESRAMESAKRLHLVLEHHLNEHSFWYAMPYHPGDHLGFVTKKFHDASSPLTVSQLKIMLRYEFDLLRTLQSYHRAGLWHKDVKPDNIIIHYGTASLVDLGLVTPLASAMTLTTHGTEYFRDPELVRQAMRGVKVHQIDGTKFDVYGAGAVLYFMLENTFPAHGVLSNFSKESPECLRWIVRRAMADYDKRYASIDEMLADVEKLLSKKDILSVRPADLPSMGGKAPVESVRRLPAQTTPPTGGGPFLKSPHKTRPLGLVALITAVVIGTIVIMDVDPTPPPSTITQTSLLQYPPPIGRLLLINDLPFQDTLTQEVAAEKIQSLIDTGWDVFEHQALEAKVRTWLPRNLDSIQDQSKFAEEGLLGILVLQAGLHNTIEAVLVEDGEVHTFIIDY